MTYTSLAEKIKLLPEECLDEIDNYVDQILSRLKNNSKIDNNTLIKPTNDSTNCKRKIGIANGKYTIPENIDLLNDEVAKLFGVE